MRWDEMRNEKKREEKRQDETRKEEKRRDEMRWDEKKERIEGEEREEEKRWGANARANDIWWHCIEWLHLLQLAATRVRAASMLLSIGAAQLLPGSSALRCLLVTSWRCQGRSCWRLTNVARKSWREKGASRKRDAKSKRCQENRRRREHDVTRGDGSARKRKRCQTTEMLRDVFFNLHRGHGILLAHSFPCSTCVL